jgi:hypothetical protein
MLDINHYGTSVADIRDAVPLSLKQDVSDWHVVNFFGVLPNGRCHNEHGFANFAYFVTYQLIKENTGSGA